MKEISIPTNISTAEILFDFQNFLIPYNIEVVSNENIDSGKVFSEIVDIDDSRKILAKTKFVRNPLLKRDEIDLCIVLKNVEQYTLEEISQILNYSSYYTVFLPRNLNRIDLQAEIINSRKEYIIYFDIGDYEDYEADFRKSQDIGYKINNICNHYQKDKALILSNPKKLYDFEKEIITNLSYCRGNIFSDTLLIDLNLKATGENRYLEFEEKLTKLSKSMKEKKAFIIDVLYSEFEYFMNSLRKLEKKGYRFNSFLNYFKTK